MILKILLFLFLFWLALVIPLAFIRRRKRTRDAESYLAERKAERERLRKKEALALMAVKVYVPEPNEGRGDSYPLCLVVNYPSLEAVKEKFKGTHLGPMSVDLEDHNFYEGKYYPSENTVELVNFSNLEDFIKEYRPYMGHYSLKLKEKTGKTFATIKEEAQK